MSGIKFANFPNETYRKKYKCLYSHPKKSKEIHQQQYEKRNLS